MHEYSKAGPHGILLVEEVGEAMTVGNEHELPIFMSRASPDLHMELALYRAQGHEGLY